jgi:RND family efflux transporter MFP subunit
MLRADTKIPDEAHGADEAHSADEAPDAHEARGAHEVTPSRPVQSNTAQSNTARSNQEPSAPASARKVWVLVGLISVVTLGFVGATRLQGQEAPPARSEAGTKPPVVRVATARQGSIPLVGSYRGELVAEAAELAARSSGRLLAVNGQLGDTFEKGDVLARVDALEPERQVAEADAQIAAAAASVERVEAQLQAAEVEAERGVQLRANSLLSEQELTALRSQVNVLKAELNAARAQVASSKARATLLRAQIADARLLAPFAGAIAERYLDPGSSVQPGTPVLRLVRGGPLRVRFRVPERDLRHVQNESPLEVTTQATGARRFAGKLLRISAEVSRSDRTLAAEGVLGAEHDELRPGMYAHVSLTFGTLEEVTLVPSSAISERVTADGVSETTLFVVDGERAERKVITLLGRHLDESAVEGLPPGAQVVSFGHEALRDSGPVRVAREKTP